MRRRSGLVALVAVFVAAAPVAACTGDSDRGAASDDQSAATPTVSSVVPAATTSVNPATTATLPPTTSQPVLVRSELDDDQGFLWGTATSAYQVEGGHDADGKGVSVWDTYTNDGRITELLTGSVQTGNDAAQHHDLEQFRSDLALMAELGVETYRFSISWSRVLPDGTGEVNDAGLRYYRTIVEELIAVGIEPVVTLFHWDLPQALADRGGFADRASVDWFAEYADVVFDALGDLVPTFLTLNEPEAYTFLVEPVAQAIVDGAPVQLSLPSAEHAARAPTAHHLLLAHAAAVERYRDAGHGGRIGIVVNTSPAVPGTDTPADVAAAELADQLAIGWFLDPLHRGEYPARASKAITDAGAPGFIEPGDLERIAAAEPDLVGVNYYAPDVVVADPTAEHFGIRSLPNPDPVPMFLGPDRPERLTELLLRLAEDYDDLMLVVTENGASFPGDDDLVAGTVDDGLRADYVRRHVDATLDARDAGADVRGYFLWSFVDNFEWFFGYDRRFGIVHVDHGTQQRTPKRSFGEYQRIIESDGESTR